MILSLIYDVTYATLVHLTLAFSNELTANQSSLAWALCVLDPVMLCMAYLGFNPCGLLRVWYGIVVIVHSAWDHAGTHMVLCWWTLRGIGIANLQWMYAFHCSLDLRGGVLDGDKLLDSLHGWYFGPSAFALRQRIVWLRPTAVTDEWTARHLPIDAFTRSCTYVQTFQNEFEYLRPTRTQRKPRSRMGQREELFTCTNSIISLPGRPEKASCITSPKEGNV